MKLSVAMCTYNGGRFLKEQLDSILNQTLKVDEIIVCDDISTDNTLTILEEYSNKNPNLFKIYKNEKNLRSVKNFEKAISLCRGDIIFLSDQDDIWVENKIEDYVKYFNNHQNINVLASNGYCIDQYSNVYEKYAFWDAPQFLKDLNINFDYFKIITHISNIATGASMAFRKSIVPDILPFPLMNNFHHDEWIAIISSSINSFDLLNKKYFYYRIHDNQQVGGVFYEKNYRTKKMILDLFDVESSNCIFKNYKNKIKKIGLSFERNYNLSNHTHKHQELFKKNIHSIENLYYFNKRKFRKSFPIKSFFLSISDKILNKRQGLNSRSLKYL
jgi:glycosyltransferase involved in cell wall biosynthesis